MPVPADQDAVLESLRDWLYKANPTAVNVRFDADTDLIESHLLESLQFVELILHIEHQTGRQILAENLNPALLRTLNAIYKNFFEPQE